MTPAELDHPAAVARHGRLVHKYTDEGSSPEVRLL